MNKSNCESATSAPKRSDKEEMLHMADDKMDIHCANRDGDIFFIECSSCHSVDLKTRKVLMCRECSQHFQPYFEDGHVVIESVKQWGKTFYDSVNLVSFDKGNTWYVPYPRHDIKSMNPDRVKILGRDLQKSGKDCHGHATYKKFLLIPVD